MATTCFHGHPGCTCQSDFEIGERETGVRRFESVLDWSDEETRQRRERSERGIRNAATALGAGRDWWSIIEPVAS